MLIVLIVTPFRTVPGYFCVRVSVLWNPNLEWKQHRRQPMISFRAVRFFLLFYFSPSRRFLELSVVCSFHNIRVRARVHSVVRCSLFVVRCSLFVSVCHNRMVPSSEPDAKVFLWGAYRTHRMGPWCPCDIRVVRQRQSPRRGPRTNPHRTQISFRRAIVIIGTMHDPTTKKITRARTSTT